MDKRELVQIIENFAPLTLAELWDCSGWLVETNKTNVNKIMLCLTVTEDVVKQAKSQNCDMIVSHHPLFFIPFEYSGMDIYCAHTNLDRTSGGTTDALMQILDMPITQVGEDGFVRYFEFCISTDELCHKLSQISKNFRLINNKNISNLKKIAFCSGSGSEFIKDAEENGADAFVTGDIKFHTAIDSEIVLFDIGHFESEIHILKVLEKLFLSKVETVLAIEKSPFIYINKN